MIGAAKTTASGAVLAYLVDALTYVASVASLGFIRVPFQATRDDRQRHSLAAQVQEGLKFLWADSRLRTLALTTWALSFLYAPVSLAMIVLAHDDLHASARVIGLIFSLSAVGGLLGAWLAPRIKERLSFGSVIVGAIALQALVTPLVGLAVSPLMMIVGWSIAFLLDPIISMASTSYRLSVIPDDIQGRVQSIYRLGGYGAEPLGTALGGLCIALIGPRTEILAVAAGVGLCAVALRFTPIPKTRWPDLGESHQHEHDHERIVHTHEHVHDEHHQHEHAPGVDAAEPHTHEHTHEPLTHSHPHHPDIHHRHGHD
jgi:predicted MFS family arabinose efflux permease